MKYEIFQSDKNQKYYFNLKAKNGQVILSSQGYTNKAGAKNGCESVSKNCSNDDCYDRKVAKNGKHHFNVLAANKQIIGSSQMYASKSSMEAGVKAVKRVGPEAGIVDLTA